MYGYRKKNIIMVVMIVAVLLMAVGYALLSTTFNISGTSDLTGSWGVKITNVTYQAVGKAYNISDPTFTDTTVKFNVGVKVPGDKMTFSVTVQNFGNIDALLMDIDANAVGTESIIYNIDGINSQEILSAGQSKTFTVSTYFDINATELPTITTKDLTVKLNYVQYDEQILNPIPPVVDNAILTTLSGNNTLTLSNNYTSTLINYKIIGNSVQDGTPTPEAPVEIQSVGEKTKNMVDIFNRTSGTFSNGANTAVRQFEFDKYYVGLTMNNYFYPTSVNSHSITDDSVTINPKYGGYGIGYPVKVKANTKYSISWGEGENIGIGFYTSSGEYISHVNGVTSYSFTTPENCTIITVVLRPTVGKDTTYKFIQLEEGSTATEYEPYGYKLSIKVSGKNLFNINNVVSSNVVVNNNNGTLSVTPQATSSGVYAGDPRTLRDYAPNLEVGKTYTLSADTTGTGNRIYLNITKRAWQFGQSLTITEEDLQSDVVWYANGTDTTFTAVISNIQIEEGTVATEYEPYSETTTIIYLDEPLRKVGDYFDYIDFREGKVVRNITALNISPIGQINGVWTPYSSYNTYYYVFTEDTNYKYVSNVSFVSNVLLFDGVKNTSALSNLQDNKGVLFYNQSLERYRVTINEATFNKLNVVDECIIYYPKATPTEEKLELPNIPILKGTTILSVSSNGVSVPIEVSYYKMP